MILTDIARLRKLVWHLRSGGPKQVRAWLERDAAEAGHRRLETVRGAEGAWVGRRKKRRLRFRPAAIRPGLDRSPGAPRVGVILDDFSAMAFGAEWDCVHLSPAAWRDELRDNPVDFLFVESAWSGSKRAWAGKIAHQDHTGSELRELARWCGQQGIPTVFWNKEDPPHYQDFLEAAKLFDHVFTSDANMLGNYAQDLGHDRVAVLAFAAQPALHNPVRPRFGWHERDIAFGGMYFAHKYPERRDQLDVLLRAALSASASMDTGLEIFSRQMGGDEKYQFPEPFAGRVVGSLEYAEMVTAYKAYKTFLNVNSVVDSPSMCSRRVFEIVASGANVMTTSSPAISNYFEPDEIFAVDSGTEAEHLLRALHRNPGLGDRQLHRGQRRIWRDHTYKVRSEQILAAISPGIVHGAARPTVSALVSTIRPGQLEHVFQTIGSQLDVEVELILLTHGFELDRASLQSLQAKYGVAEVTLLSADRSVPLGTCLNMCIAAASAEVLTKMDDDDYYAPNYLSDQLYALEYSGADVVGKQAHYMYLAEQNATLLRFAEWEHRYTRMVMGPTIMAKSETFRANPFAAIARGEDTQFLKGITLAGGAVYSSDRFNYCQQRLSADHTWNVRDSELLASGQLKFFGNYRDEVSV